MTAMRRRIAATLAVALLAVGGLAACGHSGLPRTSANLAICKRLAMVLEGKAILPDLAGKTFESNAPVTHRLRQDIATYIGLAADNPSATGTHEAAVKAEADCASIRAPVAPGYG
jgi:hypothetical protein